MTIRIRLPGGTLKIKRYPELRGSERTKQVPILSIGRVYFIWWSRSATRTRRFSMEHSTAQTGLDDYDD